MNTYEERMRSPDIIARTTLFVSRQYRIMDEDWDEPCTEKFFEGDRRDNEENTSLSRSRGGYTPSSQEPFRDLGRRLKMLKTEDSVNSLNRSKTDSYSNRGSEEVKKNNFDENKSSSPSAQCSGRENTRFSNKDSVRSSASTGRGSHYNNRGNYGNRTNEHFYDEQSNCDAPTSNYSNSDRLGNQNFEQVKEKAYSNYQNKNNFDDGDYTAKEEPAFERSQQPRSQTTGSYQNRFSRNQNNRGFENGDNGDFNSGFSISNRREESNMGGGRPPQYIPQTFSNEEVDVFSRNISSGIEFRKYNDIKVQISGGDNTQTSLHAFDKNSGINKHILENIIRCNFTHPTPIQKFTIPVIQKNEYDLMGCAQTGSGKTAAFLIPTFSYLLDSNFPQTSEVASPHVLVIGPTRELVTQIFGDMRKFAFKTPIKTGVCYGGVGLRYIMSYIRYGCDSLASTPGRLIEMLNRGLVSVHNVKFLILDEGDRMLDMGFLVDIKKIIYNYGMPDSTKRRTYMFSATFPIPVQKLAREILTEEYFFLTVGIVGGAADTIKQELLRVSPREKRDTLVEIIQNNEDKKILVFVDTKRGADFLTTFLCQNQIKATSIHGDRTQEQREAALADFTHGETLILVATSVAARGLDIPNVNIVVNFDLPKEIDEYVHRIGRTGRMGNRGSSITFYSPGKDDDLSSFLITVLKNAKQEIPEFLKSMDYAPSGATNRYVNFRDERNISRKNLKAYCNFNEGENESHKTNAIVSDHDDQWD